jgi:hypothetical protein
VRAWVAIFAGLALAACGGSPRREACAAASVKTAAPPAWAAPAFADSSPGLKIPYALAAGGKAAAVFFARLRAGHPTNPYNKVLWIVRAPRDGKPLRIIARQGETTVRITRPADSGPGEIYPSYVDLPSPGCWRLDLAWGPHRTQIDLAVAAGPRRTNPGRLGGAPLKGRSGLRLLVAGAPPYVLDVDSGQVTRVGGLRLRRFPVVGVQGVGRDAALWVDPGDVYVVGHGSLRARRIGAGREVAADRGGRAVWLIEGSGSDCALAEVSLTGRTLGRPRPVSCAARLLAGGALVDGPSVRALPGVAPRRIAAPWAVAGPYVLGSKRPLTLTDLRTGESRTFAWPSAIRFPDEAAAAPDGRHIALDFADPAYHSTGTQVMDAWLLDTRTGRLTQLPGMPAIVHLKFTSFAWAPDGRLVLLSQDAGLVAVWRPGDARLAVRRVQLPRPSGGTDAFTVR